MNSVFPENKKNELSNSSITSYIKGGSILQAKNYLENKRKRINKDLKEGIDIFKKKIENDSNETKKNKKIEEKKEESTFKFQNLSKNIFSIIFAYLRLDDLLKLKFIGSKSILLYVNDLLCLMQSNNKLTLLETDTRRNHYMDFNDSINFQKYYLINGNCKIKVEKNIKVKFALYHKPTNKNYVLIYYKLKYCFCDIEKDNNIIVYGKNSSFNLPDKEYYEKFQFLEEFNKFEVAIFSICKILLYNISTGIKDHCIYLNRSCDFILYKKELKLLIVPHLTDEIEFFKIYNWKKNIKNSRHIFQVEANNPIILNFSDYVNNEKYDTYICIYSIGGKKIFIYDCKLLKTVHTIESKSSINRVNINNKYIIFISSYIINYYSISDNEYLNSFNLNDISKKVTINYISPLDYKYLDNMFLIITQTQSSNKIAYKPILMLLENNNNNFYYCFSPIKNKINDYIFNSELIYNSLKDKKIKNEKEMKMSIIACHLNKLKEEDLKNESLNNILVDKNSIDKNDFYIKEYSVTL